MKLHWMKLPFVCGVTFVFVFPKMVCDLDIVRCISTYVHKQREKTKRWKKMSPCDTIWYYFNNIWHNTASHFGFQMFINIDSWDSTPNHLASPAAAAARLEQVWPLLAPLLLLGCLLPLPARPLHAPLRYLLRPADFNLSWGDFIQFHIILE